MPNRVFFQKDWCMEKNTFSGFAQKEDQSVNPSIDSCCMSSLIRLQNLSTSCMRGRIFERGNASPYLGICCSRWRRLRRTVIWSQSVTTAKTLSSETTTLGQTPVESDLRPCEVNVGLQPYKKLAFPLARSRGSQFSALLSREPPS